MAFIYRRPFRRRPGRRPLPFASAAGGAAHEAIVATSGVRVTGAAITAVTRHRSIIAAAGVAVTGAGVTAVTRHRSIAATSGVELSGAALVSEARHRAIIATAGVVTTGAAVVAPHQHRAIIAASGVATAGEAVLAVTRHRAIVAASGAVVTGAAVLTTHAAISGSGGLYASGVALVVPTQQAAPVPTDVGGGRLIAPQRLAWRFSEGALRLDVRIGGHASAHYAANDVDVLLTLLLLEELEEV